MNTDSQYIPALEAMQQINMPPDVFVAILRSHEAELPLSRNDEELTIRKAIEHMDFRCMRWKDIHRKFYTKELQNADSYLRYFKLYLPHWHKFVATHKELLSLDVSPAEAQASLRECGQPEPQELAASPASVKNTDTSVETSTLPAQKTEDVAAHIAAWEAVIPMLAPKEQRVARVVIEKWRNKSHQDCYMAVYGDVPIAEDSKIKKIYRAKKTAEDIAGRYSLKVPLWPKQG